MMRVDLPAACGRFLDGVMREDDPSVWRIGESIWIWKHARQSQ
jgi:hypothetical protein